MTCPRVFGFACAAALMLLGFQHASAAITYSEAVMADSPVGYWRLDETAGTTAADSTFPQNDGEYLNGVTLGRPGAIYGDPGTAAGFNGTDQKVDIPYSADLNPASFSFEVWARVEPGTDTNHRSPMTSRANSPQQGYIFYAQGGTWQFWTGPGWDNLSAPAGSVVEDQWTHLVGTYDAATQTKRLFVNGWLSGTQTEVTVDPNGSKPLRLGGGATEGLGNYFFRGDLDEVAVYDTTLSFKQVRTHFNAANANYRRTYEFANPGDVGLGADASQLVLAGHTANSPTPTNPDGLLVLGGNGTGGLVFPDAIPKGINFDRPLVIETDAFYLNGDAPGGQANAYMGLKALHLMGDPNGATDAEKRRGGLWAQFQPYTTGSGHMRIGFQGAAESGSDLWDDDLATKSISGFADANGVFNMQLSIEGLDDSDEILFLVSQGDWSDILATTIGGYRNGLSGEHRDAFELVLSELRADPSRMQVGFISTAAREDAYDYLRVYATVPEPSTVLLFGLGGLGVVALGWRRRARRGV